mmetsp:Transcript_42306/g.89992  ORF Transcript_42306/g.89992 Transcript_42306/m.89992 type:complete len:256 (+) Transcript_42306:3795-4562(+)
MARTFSPGSVRLAFLQPLPHGEFALLFLDRIVVVMGAELAQEGGHVVVDVFQFEFDAPLRVVSAAPRPIGLEQLVEEGIPSVGIVSRGVARCRAFRESVGLPLRLLLLLLLLALPRRPVAVAQSVHDLRHHLVLVHDHPLPGEDGGMNAVDVAPAPVRAVLPSPPAAALGVLHQKSSSGLANDAYDLGGYDPLLLPLHNGEEGSLFAHHGAEALVAAVAVDGGAPAEEYIIVVRNERHSCTHTLFNLGKMPLSKR